MEDTSSHVLVELISVTNTVKKEFIVHGNTIIDKQRSLIQFQMHELISLFQEALGCIGGQPREPLWNLLPISLFYQYLNLL